MTKDPDLNRDVQNELNQIFPEPMTQSEHMARSFGRVQGIIEFSMTMGVFPVDAAKRIHKSLVEMDKIFSTDLINNRGFISELNTYIEKHDQTTH